ncbi:Murein DD-endopeptidase MepM and murein hydrolase activator NlpD, contain LysM domain [Colwellia chukchiensis]|uniref:Murein DD-endopeptidase MepM and murein hydrolase activator NlpD, contain LysM domain n=1 Tax=Colwellia chukchiensis TaxID=641665 RepID=A0A1H7LNA6_9GAMM|nr:peptidoglycan DD-metalloendopeptidase family protein [Colwellia chukchiensis]SEK99857.1 Murein DD-endopeptidase MepM and murein hydrolase activator NlpD, contain LysM domain [Colwellia chukchiensis]
MNTSLLKNIQNIYFNLPKQHQIIIALCAISAVVLLLLPASQPDQDALATNGSLQVGHRYQVALPEQADNTAQSNPIQLPAQTVDNLRLNQEPSITPSPTQEDKADKLAWVTVTVKRGDSLAKIFQRHGLNATTTHKVITAQGDDSGLLKKLNVGDMMRLGKNDAGQLVSLEYPLSKNETLFVNLQKQQYIAHKESKAVEVREAFAQGEIRSNFWQAASAAGLNDGQIINLANVFGWDIDFAMDIRAGDSFNVIYENQYVDGEFIGTGKILAAEFINQGESFQAIRFTDGEYYSADGRSMRKAFLRAPVSFRYISSDFKPKRFHPIQKRWKAHNGTDYSAKKGTPVVAAGNGRVTHSTYNKYNGNYVFIQHGNGIVTKYLHFSKRAVKKGQRVKQGQVIGYVGSTGMSQAPHLHYEFLLNGVHRNPRTVKLPDAKPISSKYRAEFDAIAKQRLAELSGSRRAMLAMQDTEKNE